MRSVTRTLAIVMLYTVAVSVQAAQILEAKDGDTLSIKISQSGVTRISVQNGMIRKVSGKIEDANFEEDKKNGHLYVTPIKGSNKSFNFLISDDAGGAYTIIAQPFDIASQTVFIKPLGRKIKNNDNKYKNESFVKNVKMLMKSLMNGEDEIPGYSMNAATDEIKIWEELRLKRLRLFVGPELDGEVYIMINESDTTVRVAEKEFLSVGEGVRAVSIEKHEFGPDESTYLFIARDHM